MRYLLYFFLLLSISVGFISCMKVGPDFVPPKFEDKIPPTFENAIHKEDKNIIILDKWWETFNDPVLNRIVNKVIKNNLDIRKATFRILELYARYKRAHADRYPSLNIGGEFKEIHKTVTGLIPTLRNGRLVMQETSSVETIDNYSLAFAASYEFDLWGRLKRSEEAEKARLLESKENRETIVQGIISEAIKLYFEIKALKKRIFLAKENIETTKNILTLVENRYKSGLSSILEVEKAKTSLEQAKIVLPKLLQDLGTCNQQLLLLMGEYPKISGIKVDDAWELHLDPVPVGLPSELLKRRPDIRAAEKRLKALNAMVGVARAARFPHISLTGNYGYASDSLSDLFKPKSELWNLAIGIIQPLFDAGRLKANEEAAKARYKQGLMEYSKIVLKAFFEVENSLFRRQKQLEIRKVALNLLKEATITYKVAKSRYESGLIDYLHLLDAQKTLYQARDNIVLIDFGLLTNRIALHRALGGGFGHDYSAREVEDISSNP